MCHISVPINVFRGKVNENHEKKTNIWHQYNWGRAECFYSLKFAFFISNSYLCCQNLKKLGNNVLMGGGPYGRNNNLLVIKNEIVEIFLCLFADADFGVVRCERQR